MLHLFLAPHYDDAVYSCGGTIYTLTSRGERVIVLTICAGYPPAGKLSDFAQHHHERWGVPEPSQAIQMIDIRQAEDKAACAILGAETMYWTVPDCIYRSTPAGRWFYINNDELFGAVDPFEWLLADMITKAFAEMEWATELVKVYAPLGIGNHIDHQIVRRAAEQAFGKKHLNYYSDYPYMREPGVLDAYAADANWSDDPSVEILPEGVQKRIDAMMAYQSQLSSFWENTNELADEVRQLMADHNGEKLWRWRGG